MLARRCFSDMALVACLPCWRAGGRAWPPWGRRGGCCRRRWPGRRGSGCMAAQRKWTKLALPDCLATGLAPALAAACSAKMALAPDQGCPLGHRAGWRPRSWPPGCLSCSRDRACRSGWRRPGDRRRVVGGRRCTAGRRASSCRRDRTWAQRLAAVHDRAVGGLDRHRQRMGAGGRGPTDRWPGPSRPRHDPASPRTLKQLGSRRLPATAAGPRTAG
jgi:hypothetical protein